MYSMMLTLTQAADEFSDIMPVFTQAWTMAWSDILSRFNEPGWDNSCRSHVLQMQAVIHARELFSGNKEVRYFTYNNRHVFAVRNNGLFKVKQLDENHCSSNAKTTAAVVFDSQAPLEGFAEFQRFTVGLLPKADWLDYIGIYLTFPNGFREKPNWVLDITSGKPVDIEALQNEFPEHISQPERRFKPKKQSEKRADGTGI